MSCGGDNETPVMEDCFYDNFVGEYMFYSGTDTSNHNFKVLSLEGNRFQTSGINGSGFWFPVAPLSGEIIDCQIVLDTYDNVERPGLSSPGGNERFYYESMSGFGEYYPNEDSIKIFVDYDRTGDFKEDFSGEIIFVKIE